MKNVFLLPYFLIGFSYTFLLYNKIFFGVSIILGIITLFFLNKESIKLKFKFEDNLINIFFFLTIFFFIICSFTSKKPERSILVTIYLVLFIVLSLNLFHVLLTEETYYEKFINIFITSTIINILIIFVYNIYESGLFTGNLEIFGIKKYKGLLNIFSILALVLFFFKKSKLFLIPLILIIPSLYLSNSSAPILGMLVGTFALIVFKMIKKFNLNKIFYFSFAVFFSIIASLFIKELPKNFDQNSINNYNFKIPISVLDAHRQFIWGFSLSKFHEKPIFGYGPDTSNFIEDGQRVIGSKFTGTMKFIPSHPHNFLIELILETGLLGTLSFIMFIIVLNYKIFLKANTKERGFLIFFNGYFWGASLVNFSFWQAWWQCSYFFLLSLIASKIIKFSIEQRNETF